MTNAAMSKAKILNQIITLLNDADEQEFSDTFSRVDIEKNSQLPILMKLDFTKVFIKSMNLLKEIEYGVMKEPEAWRILLEIYYRSNDSKKMAITDVSNFVGTPATTILRWLSVLYDRKLIERIPDPFDKRRVWIEISDYGKCCIENWLSFCLDEFSKLFSQLSSINTQVGGLRAI